MILLVTKWFLLLHSILNLTKEIFIECKTCKQCHEIIIDNSTIMVEDMCDLVITTCNFLLNYFSFWLFSVFKKKIMALRHVTELLVLRTRKLFFK